MEKSKVYYTKEVTPEKVVEMFKLLNKELVGNVATKVHSGEEGNQNYLKPEFWKPIIEYDPKSKGALAYLNLAKEVIERNGK